jgi:5-(carboxyamino)imidazole ribonucleotide synthase
VPQELEARAEELAAVMVAKLGIEGLLCIEFFVTRQGELLVNELAPRPHNSYHQSERGCVTSQFEQAVRAACNLPLGSTELISPCAIVNLLGDVWLNGEPDFPAALAVPGVRLHLYEKHTPRAGRKMGHLSATGATAEEALERVLEAKRRLGR